jgi:hypothetical protein
MGLWTTIKALALGAWLGVTSLIEGHHCQIEAPSNRTIIEKICPESQPQLHEPSRVYTILHGTEVLSPVVERLVPVSASAGVRIESLSSVKSKP